MADIDSALQILSRNNYKLTKQRKELLKYLYQFQSEYINVSQVDEFMHQLYPKMSHNTVYRNIRDFDRLGSLRCRRGRVCCRLSINAILIIFTITILSVRTAAKSVNWMNAQWNNLHGNYQDIELRAIALKFMGSVTNACKNSKIVSRYIKITF